MRLAHARPHGRVRASARRQRSASFASCLPRGRRPPRGRSLAARLPTAAAPRSPRVPRGPHEARACSHGDDLPSPRVRPNISAGRALLACMRARGRKEKQCGLALFTGMTTPPVGVFDLGQSRNSPFWCGAPKKINCPPKKNHAGARKTNKQKKTKAQKHPQKNAKTPKKSTKTPPKRRKKHQKKNRAYARKKKPCSKKLIDFSGTPRPPATREIPALISGPRALV